MGRGHQAPEIAWVTSTTPYCFTEAILMGNIAMKVGEGSTGTPTNRFLQQSHRAGLDYRKGWDIAHAYLFHTGSVNRLQFGLGR